MSDNSEAANTETAARRIINAMTNYERTQWAKAGYPGLSRSNYDLEKLEAFVNRKRFDEPV